MKGEDSVWLCDLTGIVFSGGGGGVVSGVLDTVAVWLCDITSIVLSRGCSR